MRVRASIPVQLFPAVLLITSLVLATAFSGNAFGQDTMSVTHMIFDEEYHGDWSDGSVKCKTNPEYDQWVHDGLYALGATLEKGGVLVFKRPVILSMDNYTGIGGYINGGESGKQAIGVCVIDFYGRPLPNKTGLDLRKYVQGGALPVDDWKPFAVPLQHFGDVSRGIKAICFVNASDKDMDTFYLDNFGLVDFKIASASKDDGKKGTGHLIETKKQTGSYVYSDDFQRGWQNWSWPEAKIAAKFSNDRHSGKCCLVTTLSQGSGLAFGRHEPFGTKGYKSLRFYIKGNNGAVDLKISLYQREFSEDKELSSIDLSKEDRLVGSLTAQGWKCVDIPLDRLQAEDAAISKIAFMPTGRGKQIILIDDVMFTK